MKALLILLAVLCLQIEIHACTSIIVSGKKTDNGCPLLLKQRDASSYDNCVSILQGEKYRMMVVVNSDDTSEAHALSGMNSVNLSIVNTATFNLGPRNIDNSISPGRVMFMALSTCSDLKEVETLLDSLQRSHNTVPANFGVIDAQGNGAFYEVGYKSWIKYDVNDPNVAPNGYLVRTNFSLCNEDVKGRGYERYETANYLLEQAINTDSDISVEWVLNNICRSLVNIPLNVSPELADNPARYQEKDFIARRYSTSSIIYQGVGKKHTESVMWALLGYPMTGIVVPLMFSVDLPDFVQAANTKRRSEICDWSLALKEKVLHIEGDETYINYPLLFAERNSGITQIIQKKEKKVFKRFSRIYKNKKRRRNLMPSLYDSYRKEILNVQ